MNCRLSLVLSTLFCISLLAAVPVSAFDLDGQISAGFGGGFGDEDVGSLLISGRYWTSTYEFGTEIFLDGDTGDDIDQLVWSWLAIRYDLFIEEGNSTYLGMGGGLIFEGNKYENDFGYVALLGWDGKAWGFEFKYGYYDPSLYSLAFYYNL